MDWLKNFVPMLAQMNKATVTTGVSWVSQNIALGMLHVTIGPEWQTVLVTLVLAIIHGIVVYYTPNKVQTPTGEFVTVDHAAIAELMANAPVAQPPKAPYPGPTP